MTMSILDLLQHIVNEPAPRLPAPYGSDTREGVFVDGCLMKDPTERLSPAELLVRPSSSRLSMINAGEILTLLFLATAIRVDEIGQQRPRRPQDLGGSPLNRLSSSFHSLFSRFSVISFNAPFFLWHSNRSHTTLHTHSAQHFQR